MPVAVYAPAPFWDDLVDQAVARAATWGTAFNDLFAGASGDPESAEFTRRLLELLLGDADAVSSALELKRLAPGAPASMPKPDRMLLRAGGAVSLGLPWAVMPVAKKWMRERLSHLVLATKSSAVLAEELRRISETGVVPVVRPLGDPVLGPEGVAREAARLVRLASLPGLSHLIVDPARLVPGGSDWSAEADVAAAAQALRPIFEAALAHGTVVQLTPDSVRWARLVPDVIELGLADEALDRVRVAATFMAELPESRELYSQVSRWALRRVAAGGAPVEAILGIAGAASKERVAAVRAGLSVPVVEEEVALNAQFLQLTELMLHPGRAAALRPVIATEDPLLVAAACAAATKLHSEGLFSVMLRAGVAPGLLKQIAQLEAGKPEVRVCLPITAPREYNGAIDLLVPLALEAAAAKMRESQPGAADARETTFRAATVRAAGAPQTSHRTQSRNREWDPSERDSALFYRAPDEAARFDTGGLTAAVLGLTRDETGEVELTEVMAARAIPVVSASGFANEPDTDASRAENRDWARRIVGLARGDIAARAAAARAESEAGAGEVVEVIEVEAELDPTAELELSADVSAEAHAADDNAAADRESEVSAGVAAAARHAEPKFERARGARDASARWRALGHGQRAIHLRRLALGAVAARDRLLRTLVAETGAPVSEIDAEINRLVDAARYTGQLAEGLSTVRGATFTPDELALVTGDVWAGLAAHAEAVLAALGAGSGVLWVVPTGLAESAWALLEEWTAAGLLAGSVTLEVLPPNATLNSLEYISDVDRAIVLGDRATAEALAHRRPDLKIEGRFMSRGSIIVSPSAELARAVEDVVASAFSGTMLARANEIIVVGSAGRAKRFIQALTDAVRGLRADDTATGCAAQLHPLAVEVGRLVAEPTADQLAALTELAPGEHWSLAPEALDDDGQLWRPGVRTDVTTTAPFWRAAQGLPVVGVTHVRTLNEAIRAQNRPGGGAVAGFQATAADEVSQWLAAATAARLALNCPTSDVRVERQPVGAWNVAGMGLAPLAAGPNRLVTLGAWQLRPGTPSSTLHLRGLGADVAALIEVLQPVIAYAEFDELRRAALTDSLTWRTSFAPDRDTAGLGIERNLLRYQPVPTLIRLSDGARVVELARVVAVALLVRAPITVSTGEVLPATFQAFLEQRGIEVSLEHDDDWLERIAVAGASLGAGGVSGEVPRVRLIGGDAVRTAEWFGGRDRVALWSEPVTMAGPVEILALVREQAISARAHRHGLAVPVPGLDEI